MTSNKLLALVRFYFAQSVFNATIHYKAYDRLIKAERCKRITIVVITAFTILSLICLIIGYEEKWIVQIKLATYLGLFATAGSLLFTTFNQDLCELKNNHKIIAENYKRLRDNFMFLILELMSNSYNLEKVKSTANELINEYDKIGMFAPTTTYKDYIAAQKSLGLSADDEQFTWTKEQINRFLPEELKLLN